VKGPRVHVHFGGKRVRRAASWMISSERIRSVVSAGDRAMGHVQHDRSMGASFEVRARPSIGVRIGRLCGSPDGWEQLS